MDKSQKLYRNKQKTEILDLAAFKIRANAMLVNDPSNSEEEILAIIGRYGDPYTRIRLFSLDTEDIHKLTSTHINAVATVYLSEREPNYIRLR